MTKIHKCMSSNIAMFFNLKLKMKRTKSYSILKNYKSDKSILFIFVLTVSLFSCMQSSKTTLKTRNRETVDSARNYEYTDSEGKRLIIKNSFPKSGINYTDPNDKKYIYVVFWTQISNETINPVEVKIDFPLDSFEFPTLSGNYMKILLPSDTMTMEKVLLPDYGLSIKFYLDSNRYKPPSLKRTINPNDLTAFYIVALSNRGANGVLRTGISLKGQDLFYKISVYNNSNLGVSLMEEKEIKCGSINMKYLRLRK